MDKTHILYWTHSASIEHVVPVARGGTNDPGNLVTACYQCNTIKGNWLLEELRWKLRDVDRDEKWDGLAGYLIPLADVLGKAKVPRYKNWRKIVQYY